MDSCVREMVMEAGDSLFFPSVHSFSFVYSMWIHERLLRFHEAKRKKFFLRQYLKDRSNVACNRVVTN